MRLPDGADRDFTASAYVVRDGAVLLVNHSKLGQWLQPGGHIEDGETPDEAAVRETREETGFVVEPIDAPDRSFDHASEDLPCPFNVNLHRIRDGHWHCDLAFRCRVVSEETMTTAEEHDGVEWVPEDAIRAGEKEMPENVRAAALEALELS